MSIADKLRAEPIVVTRAQFESVLAKMYEAGQKHAAQRCRQIAYEATVWSPHTDFIAEAIAREFNLTTNHEEEK